MDFVSIIKHSKWIYEIYHFSVSFIIKLLKAFVKTDEHLILFVSFGGRYFNDNPKVLYNAMLNDERYKGYKLVWAFLNPDLVDIKTPKIKINSFKYIFTALKARCWVTNTSMERGLNFTGKNTFYLHTTHTFLPKLMGYDCEKKAFSHTVYNFDCSCAQSEKEKRLQMSAYGMHDNQILISGYPKNDILCNYSVERYLELRRKLNLPNDKKVILYAPTYRDLNFAAMKCPVDFKKWESVLGHDFIVLFRAHPVVANATLIDSSSGFIFDVSGYPDNVDLMIASDILISDYSGIFFEYAVQKKPMFCYAYDYNDYIKDRNLYFDIRKVLPGGMMSEDKLLKTIKTGGFSEFESLWDKFRDDYVSEYGRATVLCLNKIIEAIQK